jgi:hypothetical protein
MAAKLVASRAVLSSKDLVKALQTVQKTGNPKRHIMSFESCSFPLQLEILI